MSTTKKVLAAIFSVLIIGAFAFLITWGVINWSKVKDGMAGNGLYTQDDVQNAYEDGYSTALTDKEEYDKLINSYRDTITTQNDLISQYTSEVTNLTKNNRDYAAQIKTLTDLRVALEEQVDLLTTIKENNEATIVDMNGQISSLVGQIMGLNSQITDLTMQMQTNSVTVNALNTKISELQQSIGYYEQYIASLETGEQVVATFEFAGSVYSIQVVNRNSLLTITNPSSTAYVIFNGWTVNGSAVDLNTYRITANTKFVADVTYKYKVDFTIDGMVYNSQVVEKGNSVKLPVAPAKDGFVFEGWTIDGNTVLDLSDYGITANMTLVAKFTKLYTVTFKYEDEIIETQTVKSGDHAVPVTVENTEYKIFNGWKINGAIVDLSERRITADTEFIADITYLCNVKFTVDDTQYGDTLYVERNSLLTEVETPTKIGYKFICWKVNGAEIADIYQYEITENTVFVAQLEKKTLDECSWNEISYISENGIAKDFFALGDTKTIRYTNGNTQVEIKVGIVGFNHDTISGTTKKAGITFATFNLTILSTMNSTATNGGGWAESKMRTETMTSLFNMLEKELQGVIKSVDKLSNNGKANGNDLITTSDKLWLFSQEETKGNKYGDGTVYEYFDTNNIRNVVKHPTIDYATCSFWTRTSSSSNSRQFWYYSTATDYSSGAMSTDEANKSFYVVFGFCV